MNIKIDKKYGLYMLILISFLGFISFVYSDIADTTRNGINVWVLLFDGKLKDFYVYCSDCQISRYFGYTAVCSYDMPIFFVFAIWDLPLYIYEKVTGLYALDNLFCLLWAKSIIIPFFIALLSVMLKIRKIFSEDIGDKSEFLCTILTSALFYIPFIIMGQYDIIYVVIMLYGIYYYLKKDEKRFIVFLGIALLFKAFAVFALIPLVIMRYKNIKELLVKSIEACVPLLFCKIVQHFFMVENVEGSDAIGTRVAEFVFQGRIPFFYNGAALFFFAYFVFCFFLFVCEKKEEMEKKMALYAPLVSFSIFFITCKSHPQWILSLMPLMVLIEFCNTENNKILGLLLETVLSLGYIICCIVDYYWVFNGRTSAFMVPGHIWQVNGAYINISLRDILQSFCGMDSSQMSMIGGGLVCAALCCFIVIENPMSKLQISKEINVDLGYVFAFRVALMMLLGGGLLLLIL